MPSGTTGSTSLADITPAKERCQQFCCPNDRRYSDEFPPSKTMPKLPTLARYYPQRCLAFEASIYKLEAIRNMADFLIYGATGYTGSLIACRTVRLRILN